MSIRDPLQRPFLTLRFLSSIYTAPTFIVSLWGGNPEGWICSKSSSGMIGWFPSTIGWFMAKFSVEGVWMMFKTFSLVLWIYLFLGARMIDEWWSLRVLRSMLHQYTSLMRSSSVCTILMLVWEKLTVFMSWCCYVSPFPMFNSQSEKSWLLDLMLLVRWKVLGLKWSHRFELLIVELRICAEEAFCMTGMHCLKSPPRITIFPPKGECSLLVISLRNLSTNSNICLGHWVTSSIKKRSYCLSFWACTLSPEVGYRFLCAWYGYRECLVYCDSIDEWCS